MSKPNDDGAGKEPRKFRSEMHRRQRAKNFAMLAVLVGLVILFYVGVIVRRLGG